MTHPAIEHAVFMYFTSDDTGINIRVRLRGPIPFPEAKETPTIPDTLPDIATDWRYMTAEEVKMYKDDQDNED
jgi:hypothetical protein